MSQPIEINGKKVYSDKQMVNVTNTRITYSDGSWCDVATGEVVNKGAGYINIGSPSSEGSSQKTVEKTFDARNLNVKSMFGTDLEVLVHDLPQVVITIVGPEGLVKGFILSQNGNTAYIAGPEDSDNGGISIRGTGNRGVQISGSSISIGGGNIQIGGMRGGSIRVGGSTIVMGGGESEVKVTVKVPKGAALDITDVSGTTKIGDTDGKLTISNSTGGDSFVGRVKDTTIRLQRSSDVRLDEVNGDLNVSGQGSGDVTVKRGTVGNLSVQRMGSGDFKFHGKAQTANLSVMGSGDIYVQHVEQRPTRSVMGSGEIEIGNW